MQNEWIEWKGGECPVDGDAVVEYRMRINTKPHTERADALEWDHYDDDPDIIAYRLHKPAQSLEQLCAGVTEQNKPEPQFCESVMRTIPDQPTIESLAADYRNKLDYANRKQQEADGAKLEAGKALRDLEDACEAIGFMISLIKDDPKPKPEPVLSITDWRDLKVGDVIWIGRGNSDLPSGEYEVQNLNDDDDGQPFMVRYNGLPWWPNINTREWRFIRRP